MRVRVAVISLVVLVRVTLSPSSTEPEGPIQIAEGMLVSPEMVSRTVQVRVRPPLPATGPSPDTTSVSTSTEPGGTAREEEKK